MPAIIEWSDKLSVNISLFDNEHKKLIALINNLHDAMSRGAGHAVLEKMLGELADYTVKHFKEEEEAMQKYTFPGLAEHKKEHEAFVSKVADTQSQYKKGAITLTVPVFSFLTSWLQNHIMKMDAGYSDFLIKAGMR